MKEQLLRVQTKIKILLDDNGQDLIEYALVVALIAFAATVGMGNVANGINNAFSTISSKLQSAIT
jgi:pilus assembly protein Flp/PilA